MNIDWKTMPLPPPLGKIFVMRPVFNQPSTLNNGEAPMNLDDLAYGDDMNRVSPEELGMLEVRLRDPEDFLKIKETVTRIGIPSFKNKVLYQSCHILHKQGRYFIAHFKEVFALDGKPSTISPEDIQRRNMVVKLLVEWNLCDAVGYNVVDLDVGDIFSKTKILKHSEKNDWSLESKHNLGKQRS